MAEIAVGGLSSMSVDFPKYRYNYLCKRDPVRESKSLGPSRSACIYVRSLFAVYRDTRQNI